MHLRKQEEPFSCLLIAGYVNTSETCPKVTKFCWVWWHRPIASSGDWSSVTALRLRPVWFVFQVSGLPGLHRETCSQKEKPSFSFVRLAWRDFCPWLVLRCTHASACTRVYTGRQKKGETAKGTTPPHSHSLFPLRARLLKSPIAKIVLPWGVTASLLCLSPTSKRKLPSVSCHEPPVRCLFPPPNDPQTVVFHVRNWVWVGLHLSPRFFFHKRTSQVCTYVCLCAQWVDLRRDPEKCGQNVLFYAWNSQQN